MLSMQRCLQMYKMLVCEVANVSVTCCDHEYCVLQKLYDGINMLCHAIDAKTGPTGAVAQVRH